MLIPDIIGDASKRFSAVQMAAATSARRTGRKQQPPEAESAERERDLKRRARLSRTAATQTARSLVLAADAVPNARASQRRVIESIAQERLLGTDDLLDINFLELAVAVARGVGRVRIANGFGTGFLVGPGLLMTNHHIIGSDSDAFQASLQLDYQDTASGEVLPVQSFRLDPAIFFVSDQKLDFTIVGVQPISDRNRPISSYPWIQLIPDTGKADVGDPVNIIQHPRGGLKQIAFRENRVMAMPQSEPEYLFYTTDTEPGSSGSPCFNDQWELIALHHSGVAQTDNQKRLVKRDGTVWKQGDDPALLNWIANEGVRVSKIVAFIRSSTLKPEWQDIIGKALTMQPPNPIEKARTADDDAGGAPMLRETGAQSATSTRGDAGAATLISANGSVSLSIPLHVTFSLGDVSSAQFPPSRGGTAMIAPISSPLPLLRPTIGAEEIAVVIDQDYSDREGFDKEFLGATIPLPEISKAMGAQTATVNPDARKNGSRFELAYYHYSVYMNKRRRTAWFSAANVDGNNRPDIGKRPADRWYQDTRISPDDQLGQEAFEPGIDRGHLTRREDTAWGADFDAALKANNDTFHFTNCSLQASLFNRGKDRWQGLELFLLEQHAKKDKRRLVVITGPILADNDPVYQNPKMQYAVRCPVQYWKVCALVREDNSLSATAFILGQEDIKGLPGFQEEAFAVALAQTTVADLEAKTGLSFGDLRNHDHFAEGGAPGTLEIAIEGGEGKRLLKPILSEKDVVV